jgi:lipopolysaccharide biosynthesis regulator YciM
MTAWLTLLRKYLPTRFAGRRFILGDYHFDLTSFEGDVADWLSKFPISTVNVEIYLALAELFRRRGEFDRAVSVHEAIAKAELTGHSPSELSLEIAQDYYAAGVLGHAEEVLMRALDGADETHSRQAFRLWLAILESEQDWQRAVELVEQYGLPGSGGVRLVNLYCEHVLQIQATQPPAQVQKVLKKARKLAMGSRVDLLSAEIAATEQRLSTAIRHYKRLIRNDPRRVHLALAPLQQLVQQEGHEAALLSFLQRLYPVHPSVRILEAIVELHQSSGAALTPKWQQLVQQQVMSGDSYPLTLYWLGQEQPLPAKVMEVLSPALQRQSLAESDVHQCTECGFQSERMRWQCPQCESWETLCSRYESKIVQDQKKVG